MKNVRQMLAAAVLGVFPAVVAEGAVLGTYTFTGADTDSTGDNGTPNSSGGNAAANVNFTSFGRTNLNAASFTDVFQSTGYSNGNNIDTNEYASFTVSATPGYALELQSLSFNHQQVVQGNNNGVTAGAVRSSFEAYGAGSGTGSTFSPITTAAPATWNFTDHTTSSAGSATFRFYGWGASSRPNAGMWLDDVTLNGDVVALARLQASVSGPTGPVIVGGSANVNVSVSNTASGGTKQQGLQYSVSSTGDVTGSGSNGSKAPGAPDNVVLSIDTSTAGTRGADVNVTSTNAYSTNGTTGATSFNQAVSVIVLDHSNASFSDVSDLNEITIDFGTVDQGSSQSQSLSIYNLLATAGYTAALDLDSISENDLGNVFSTSLSLFTDLAAEDSANFLLNFDTSTLGAFTGSYTLSLSDEDLPGASGGQTLTINTLGTVTPIPEPVALGSLGVAGGLLLLRRRG